MQEGGETVAHTIQVADRLCKVLRPHQREGVQFVFECGECWDGMGREGRMAWMGRWSD